MINERDINVIIPVYNEEKHIKKSLENIINQEWDGNIEIVIVDGNSTDNTIKIINKVTENLPDNRTIKLYNNPKRFIPISLNIACKNCTKDIIIRIDGHTYAPLNYVKESIRALKQINYMGITGGRWEISPANNSLQANAICIAVSSKFGVGNALYRSTNNNLSDFIETDTVPFGAFTKKIWNEVGGYDEKLLYDEDFDYNYRIKKLGYKILMNTNIVLNYFARKNLKLLWKQYYNYGFWGNKFCQKHKIIPNMRRFVPLAFILSLILTPFIYIKLFYFIFILYFSALLVASIYESIIKKKKVGLLPNLIITFLTLHFSYGLGSGLSLISMIKDLVTDKKY